nr:MAG TPA: hypothetical protein [Caudoviricetes sp.]
MINGVSGINSYVKQGHKPAIFAPNILTTS